MRVELTYTLKQPTWGHSRPRHPCEHQRDILSHMRQVRQLLQRHAWIAQTHDAIVMGVPLPQLSLDNAEGIPALVDGEHNRKSHLSKF